MLRVGVVAADSAVCPVAMDYLIQLGAVPASNVSDHARQVVVSPCTAGQVASFPFVIGVGSQEDELDGRADVWLTADLRPGGLAQELETLWRGRILPFDQNLQTGTRAPRLRRAKLVDPDLTWPFQAERLMRRLGYVLGTVAIRIDHIGSTSVPALVAKDLIDIQVVVADLETAAIAADLALNAGFVHVTGEWFGPGPEGGSHREEEVCVDADPGRPVNVNIRPVASPVWAETLMFRDWLRGCPDGRAEYEALKRDLAERADLDIDGYGRAKAEWVTTALARAEVWTQSESKSSSAAPRSRETDD